MKQIKKIWKKAFLLFAAIPLLLGGTVFAVSENSTVWLDVIDEAPVNLDYRVSVTVPLAFGFVVNGSRAPTDQTVISVDEGTLLLPNFTVQVTDTDSPNSDYQLQVSASPEFSIRNYSTAIDPDQNGDGQPDQDPDPAVRTGLEVTLDACIVDMGREDNGTDPHPERRAYWKAVGGLEPLKGVETKFKNYRVCLLEQEQGRPHTFSKPGDALDGGRYWDGGLNLVVFEDEDGDWDGALNPAYKHCYIFLDRLFTLDAPDKGKGFRDSGLAREPSVLGIEFDVEVGGIREQYTQVEQSVKAGRIYWNITGVNP